MKLAFNLTTCEGDADFLQDPAEAARQLQGYDGLELQVLDDPAEGLISSERVTGVHMACIPCWYALWTQDEEALLAEFGSLQEAERYYGGSLSKDALLARYRRDLHWADAFEAEYLVFHVAESRVIESFTENYAHTDEQICEASAEILRVLFADRKAGPLLLLENLWQPGMNLRRPHITRDMLSGVPYPNKGVMLDTGHLMNTNTALRTQDEAVRFIHDVIDAHEAAGFDLCETVRGVHLNASLSGEYAERIKAAPPVLADAYAARCAQMFEHVFRRDLHRPFTAAGVRTLIERLSPDYLTTELITLSQDDRYLRNSQQLRALGVKR